MSSIVSLKSNSVSERLYTGFRLIWAGFVFLINGKVILDFSVKNTYSQ